MNWTVLIILSIVAVIAASRWYTSRGAGPEVSQAELLEWIKQNSDTCILDVRSAGEYDSGHVPGAINVGHKEVLADPEKLRQYADKKIAVYCEMGVRARIAQNALVKAGFTSVYHLKGDMAAWRGATLPMETTVAGGSS